MGDNIYLGDRNGVRTPMQWSADRNAGFSRANPAAALPAGRSSTPSTTTKRSTSRRSSDNPHSLLWWMTPDDRPAPAASRVRPRHARVPLPDEPQGAGLHPCARRRDDPGRRRTCRAVVQYVELDLAAFQGRVPVELFGATEFPPIGELPYLLTLGPHAFYWFVLAAPDAAGRISGPTRAGRHGPRSRSPARGTTCARRKPAPRSRPSSRLPPQPAVVRRQGASHRIGRHRRCRAALGGSSGRAVLLLVNVEYAEGDPETYVITLAHATGAAPTRCAPHRPTRCSAS